MRRWVLPACAMALHMKCTRQRCQVALNILVMAAFSPSWGIRHDELDAAQAASGQAAQEVRPERFSFAVADGHAQHFAAAICIDTNSDDDRHRYNMMITASFDVGGIEPTIRPLSFDRTPQEGLDPLVVAPPGEARLEVRIMAPFS